MLPIACAYCHGTPGLLDFLGADGSTPVVRRDDFRAIRAQRADFTAMIKDFRPGEAVYVDGPFGTFDM